MPADTNTNGDIFGGWLLSQMDVAGGILASKIAKGKSSYCCNRRNEVFITS